ncbi:MAG: serine protease AprX [Acidimicrobiaceae bacterium]|jgi:serine protease AprX
MRIRRFVAGLCGVVLVASTAVTFTAGAAGSGVEHVGLARLLTTQPAGVPVGIATFDAVPSASTVTQLRALGLQVQPMKQLPLAIVKGPIAAMQLAVTKGVAADVYPDERIQLFDTASSDAMGGAKTRAAGFTGKGVTVAVVDSGCDATHADLADHVVHNVILFGPEYGNMPPDPSKAGDGALVVPIEQGPYNNSDLGSGHGTHVSGIIAADGSTSADHLGVAPDANLICYSIGEILFTTAVISAYDHMLDQPNLWDIDVVNNSWGNAFRAYDPSDPVNVATKAVASKGVVIVFAAGNAGSENAEVSLNPFAQPSWVISAAADSVDKVRADFSSNGLEFDNSQPAALKKDAQGIEHATYTGARIGVYHPDVTAPGDNISSTCDPVGALTAPCDGDNAEASGTSMASPHVAGAAAVLLQANPKLTPAQVQMALQVTATPVTNHEETGISAFWQAGYGHVDLAAAVNLARSKDYAKQLTAKQKAADAAVLKASPYTVHHSDLWMWDAPRATVAGVPDSKTFSISVPSKTKAIKVAVGYPSLGSVAINGMEYVATVKDSAGNTVGTTTANFWNGSSSLFVDLKSVTGLDYSKPWTVEIVGNYAVSDPDTIDSDSATGRKVTAVVAVLR